MNHYYYVDKKHSYHDHHVVHVSGCKYLPRIKDRLFLGTFYTTTDALMQARKYYPNAFGCNDCCPLTLKKVPYRSNNLGLLSFQ